jgi:hypothetical protein
VAEVVREGSSIVALVRELEPSCMSQHMRMNREGELSGFAARDGCVKSSNPKEGRISSVHAAAVLLQREAEDLLVYICRSCDRYTAYHQFRSLLEVLLRS